MPRGRYLLGVGVEAHEIELVHLAEVDAHAGAEPARQPLHQVAPVRVEEASVRVDNLVNEIYINLELITLFIFLVIIGS